MNIKTLNRLIRDYLERLAGSDDVAELRRLSRESDGDAPRGRFNRDELHERR